METGQNSTAEKFVEQFAARFRSRQGSAPRLNGAKRGGGEPVLCSQEDYIDIFLIWRIRHSQAAIAMDKASSGFDRQVKPVDFPAPDVPQSAKRAHWAGVDVIG